MEENLLVPESKEELSDDDMEYIFFFIKEYCCTGGNDTVAGADDCTKEEAIQVIVPKYRTNYPFLKRKMEKLRAQFFNEESLLQRIQTYGYEPEKFWQLLIYIKEYTNSCVKNDYLFDEETNDEKIAKMIKILENDTGSTITITNHNNERASVCDAMLGGEFLKLLSRYFDIHPEMRNSRISIGMSHDDKNYNLKKKFFIDHLLVFLKNYQPKYNEITKGKENWDFIVQCLYFVVEDNDEYRNIKYLKGYEDITDKNGKKQRLYNKHVGKILWDAIKNCKYRGNRDNSSLFYNAFLYYYFD